MAAALPSAAAALLDATLAPSVVFECIVSIRVATVLAVQWLHFLCGGDTSCAAATLHGAAAVLFIILQCTGGSYCAAAACPVWQAAFPL